MLTNRVIMKIPAYSAALSTKILIIMLIAGSFAACKKDKDDENPAEDEKPARIAIVNASPGSPELSFYYNGTKSNSSPLSYGTAFDYKDFKASTASLASALAITENGKADTLFRTNFYFAPEKSYTVFIADIPPRITFAISEDPLKVLTDNKANIRFANLSPDIGELDVSIAGYYNYESLFRAIPFKSVSAYSAVDTREKLNIKVRENGKQEVLIALADISIEEGKTYTIWLRGLNNHQNDQSGLVLSLITNK